MDFLPSLWGAYCSLCHIRMRDFNLLCSRCETELVMIFDSTPLVLDLQLAKKEKISLYSAFKYEGVLRQLILREKNRPHFRMIQKFARKIQEIWPYSFCIDRTEPLTVAWIPAKFWRPMHIVDLMMDQLGYKKNPLKLCWNTIFKKSQKDKTLPARLKTFTPPFFVDLNLARPGPVIIFDDVATSGMTLFQGVSALKKAGFGPFCCLTLAATPPINLKKTKDSLVKWQRKL